MPTPATTHTDPGRVAFDATASDRATVDLSFAPAYRLDAIYAGMTVSASIKRLEPHFAQMKALPGIDVAKLEKFGTFSEALYFAHTVLVSRAARAKKMPALADEGWKVRDILMKYATLLVSLERFPADLLKKLREGSGYRDLVEDLAALAAWFGEQPDLTGPGSLVTTDLVNRAAELARTMRDTAGLDHEIDLSQAQLIAERNKLAILLLAAHREIRRAIEYIRFYEGDAALLAPPLFVPAKKSGTKSNSSSTDPTDALATAHDALHAQREPHAHDEHEDEPLDPEDNPFAPDEED